MFKEQLTCNYNLPPFGFLVSAYSPTLCSDQELASRPSSSSPVPHPPQAWKRVWNLSPSQTSPPSSPDSFIRASSAPPSPTGLSASTPVSLQLPSVRKIRHCPLLSVQTHPPSPSLGPLPHCSLWPSHTGLTTQALSSPLLRVFAQLYPTHLVPQGSLLAGAFSLVCSRLLVISSERPSLTPPVSVSYGSLIFSDNLPQSQSTYLWASPLPPDA